MNPDYFEIEYHPEFDDDVDQFVVKKRFRRLPKQVDDLVTKEFKKGTFRGTLCFHHDTPTPYDVYKLRMPNKDSNEGAQGGFRYLYAVLTEEHIVVLLSVYYKKEKEKPPDKYISWLIDGYFMARSETDELEVE